jgi:hypothetical protein
MAVMLLLWTVPILTVMHLLKMGSMTTVMTVMWIHVDHGLNDSGDVYEAQ